MRILAIDTTGGLCSCALVEDGGATAACSRAMRIGHAEHLFPQIEATLGKAGRAPSDLDAIAVATGPGSFSGIRIGVAAARGLALALDIPALGAGVLEAVAEEAAGSDGAAILVANEAPRDRLYLQLFCSGPSQGVAPACEPLLGDPDCDLAKGLAEGTRVAGSGALRIEGRGIVRLPGSGLPDLRILARIASSRRGESPPSPLYVRPPDVRPQTPRRRTLRSSRGPRDGAL